MMKTNDLKVNNRGFAHVEALIAVLVLVVLVAIGGYVYQNNVGNSYKKNITTLFTNQGTQMKVVAESFGRPVWTSKNVTPENAAADFAYINPNISKALALTDTLAANNKPVILPGATLFSSGKNLKNSNDLMKTYVKDSYAFLKDYQALSTYAQESSKIQASMGAVLSSLGQSSSSSATPTQIATLYTSDIQGLNSIIDGYKKLTPPADLVPLNGKLISALTDLKTYMSKIVTDIKTNNTTALYSDSSSLTIASLNLVSISMTDTTALLQGNSIMHAQITKLTSDASKLTN